MQMSASAASFMASISEPKLFRPKDHGPFGRSSKNQNLHRQCLHPSCYALIENVTTSVMFGPWCVHVYVWPVDLSPSHQWLFPVLNLSMADVGLFSHNTSIAYVWMNTYPIMSDNNNAVQGRGPQTKHIETCMTNL